MKTVLIIAYDFPPARTSGVYRPLKFARFLPEFGWRPVILTVSNYPDGVTDSSLLDELPNSASIYRAYSIEPKRFEYFLFKTFFRKNASPVTVMTDKSVEKSESVSYFSIKGMTKRLVFSPLSRLTHSFLYNPDDKVGWVPLAVKTGLRAIRNESVDLIFSTSPPETNHLVGKWLNRISGKPWVTDFRDPWSDNVIKQDFPSLRRKCERSKERKVLNRSDKIINVGHRLSRMAKESFPEIAPANHTVITNGYDESDFEEFDADAIYNRNKTDHLSILNVGTIYGNSAFSSFICGFRKAVKNNPKLELMVSFVGDVPPSQEAVLRSPPLDHFTQLHGFKRHQQAIESMMSTDIVLLMPSGGDLRTCDKIIPGKVFELMRAGRPIFMIGWPGETADMIQRSQLGCFVDRTDIDGIASQIERFCRLKREGRLIARPDWEYIRQYDRRTLTEKLSGIFDNLHSGSL